MDVTERLLKVLDGLPFKAISYQLAKVLKTVMLQADPEVRKTALRFFRELIDELEGL